MKTLFIDIDGTLLRQQENYIDQTSRGLVPEPLPGTLEKLKEWEKKSYQIILTTARKPSSRRLTEETLEKHGIFYDHLLMGVSFGQRIVINDLKPEAPDTPTAVAVNLKRNDGIANLDI